nr:MAG TPA: hypothetical protein [Caudoviricetes sp.]
MYGRFGLGNRNLEQEPNLCYYRRLEEYFPVQ